MSPRNRAMRPRRRGKPETATRERRPAELPLRRPQAVLNHMLSARAQQLRAVINRNLLVLTALNGLSLLAWAVIKRFTIKDPVVVGAMTVLTVLIWGGLTVQSWRRLRFWKKYERPQ